MTVISIPKILRDKLTDEGADALVQLFDKLGDSTHKDVLEIAEDRFEKRLAQVETSIIRWMFIFWVGQVATITGILFAFFRK